MRAWMLLSILLLAPLAGLAPPAAAQSACYKTLDQEVPVPAAPGYYARVVHQRCVSTTSNAYLEDRLTYVHLAQRDASGSDARVLAHLAHESSFKRTSTGEERTARVLLWDSANVLAYREVEYASASSGGSCSATISAYTGDDNRRVASVPAPCLPLIP